jgi:hypothetical protein
MEKPNLTKHRLLNKRVAMTNSNKKILLILLMTSKLKLRLMLGIKLDLYLSLQVDSTMIQSQAIITLLNMICIIMEQTVVGIV